MSKLYGKVWAEGHPGKMSTRAGHTELTSQMLYGSKGNPMIAAEITVKWNREIEQFTMLVNIPSMGIDEVMPLEA